MSNFKVGQKVVCVDASPTINPTINTKRGVVFPIEKEIYTIRGFTRYNGGIYLEGLIHGFHHDGEEVGLKTRRFRPLDHQFAEDVCAAITEQVKQEYLIESL